MNKHAPLKTYRVKARNNPWMSRDILLLMYKSDYLCKKTKKTGNKALYTEYKQARNKVVSDIRKAKSDHYTSQINQSKSAEEMWKVIRSLMKINKSVPSPISAENFNENFSNIGPKINKTFPGDPILHWSLPESIYTFKLRPIGVLYFKIINRIKGRFSGV